LIRFAVIVEDIHISLVLHFWNCASHT